MRDLILSIAQFGVRSIIGIVAVLFGELIILIKAVGDELRHPPFIRSSNGASLDAVTRMVKKYIPEMNEAGRQQFLYAFFPFIYGIYPYTSVTEKQKAAMAQAEIPYVYQSAYDLTYTCLKKLLNAKET